MEINQNTKNEEENNNLKLPAEEQYRTLFSAGVHKYEVREFEEAADIFKDAYNKFPEKTEALINYANCQYELLNTDEAVSAWQEATQKDKFLINPYINLGNYYLANSNYPEAIEKYINAFCLDPHNEMTLTNLAITYERINNKKLAFMLYEFFLSGTLNISSTNYKNIHKKVAMHKLHAISYMKLGIYYERKGFYRKAIQSYYDSLRMFPNFAKTYSNIGNIFYKLEKFELAKDYWFEAYKADKNNLRIILNLALCCDKLEDYVNAYAFYMRFIQRTSGNNAEIQQAQASAMRLHNLIIANNDYVMNFKKTCEEFEQQEKFEDALAYYENLAILSSTNETTEKINKLNTEYNLIHKASFVSYQLAKELLDAGNYEFAMEKCKLSLALWKNSYFEQNTRNVLSKCQNLLGNTINNILRAKKE